MPPAFGVTCSRRQKPKPALQACKQPGGRKHLDPGRGKLNRQRKSIDSLANFADYSGVTWLELEVGLYGSSTLRKQHHRWIARQCLKGLQFGRIR
jgi:hypothetical protein